MDIIELKKAPDKINRGMSFIIYGDPGAGKTTMATTLPVDETLIINTEAGLGPLLGTGHLVFNVRAATVNVGLEKVISELYRQIRTKEIVVKNVVIDNLSELADQLTIHYTDVRKKEFPELRERGDAAYKMMEWIHNWRDLVDLGINVVFNAWEYPYEIQNTDGTVLTKTAPMVGKASCFKVCGLVDVVGHLEVFEKTGKRWLRLGPSHQYLTKTQFKGLDNGEPADFPTIIDKLLNYDYGKEQ